MTDLKTVVIVEDEQSSISLLQEYLQGFAALSVVAVCTNGIEASETINRLNPDLVFLDIDMPGKNGFEVLEDLRIIPSVIFTTGHEEFAVKAFEVNAVDYLLKPYTKQRFHLALDKVMKLASGVRVNTGNNIGSPVNGAFLQRVFAVFNNTLYNISASDIVRVEAYGDYTRIHTNDRFYISDYSMQELEKRLDIKYFLRVHRSSIVAIQQISEVINASSVEYLVMKNGDRVKVSRSYIPAVKSIFR